MLTLLALLPGALAAVPAYGVCEDADLINKHLDKYLGDVLKTWEVVRLDAEALEEAVYTGAELALPAIDVEGKPVEVLVPAADLEPSGGASVGYGKGPKGEVEKLEIAATWDYLLGCEKSADACGNLTFFDEGDGGMGLFEGVLLHPDVGSVVFESAPTLLQNLGVEVPLGIDPGCGIIYNPAHHAPIGDIDDLGDKAEVKDGEREDQAEYIEARVNIVLDADEFYYWSDPGTIWSRQRSLYNIARTVYGFVEPLSGSNWQIDLVLESQESWVSGGPTTTDLYDLSDEINDPGYWMLNHPQNDEVSYHFVGYDIDGGSAGIAGGICNYPGYDDTWGSAVAHQKNHALGQQIADADGGYAFATLHGRAVVMVHELGHQFGGIHGDGEADASSGGLFWWLTGDTVMLSGASGGAAPDDRGIFFSRANRANIHECLDRVF